MLYEAPDFAAASAGASSLSTSVGFLDRTGFLGVGEGAVGVSTEGAK